MTENLLPPSPNWYCSQACDCSEEGLFAYATRNVIFLLDVRTNPPSFVGCLGGHSSRVTAVKFGNGTHDKHMCATAGDDGRVKVWDVRNKAIVNEHQCHNENKVTAVEWCASTRLNSLVISGDEKGTLTWWNQTSQESKEFIPEKQHIYCLASCPHDGTYVAVGYKTGLALIVDIGGKGQIIHRLRGHDDEVHCVHWSPLLGENIHLQKSKGDEEVTPSKVHIPSNVPPEVCSATSASPSTLREQGCLLISGSRDRTIRVWNTTQGKAVMTLTLPPRGGVHRTRERGDDGGKARVWVGLCWPSNNPREFISSSYGGDVILWDLCKPGKQKWDYLGTEDSVSHNRIVFNIVTNNSDSSDMFITTSMDRQIICWSRKTRKIIWSIPTLGGFVYSLSTCPVDPGCLAVGVGDNMIRLWNTSAPGRDYSVTVLWQGIKSKVTALSWHPERDNCLAYGTDDGRVGIYNTFSQGKAPHLSSTFHKKTVYSMSWGPQCPIKEGGSTYCLYSCGGDGVIYQHDPTKPGEDANNFNSLIRSANQISHILPLRTDVSWRDDGRAVAIGNEDGSIEVLAAPSLLVLCTIQVHHKLINCLRWYPSNSHSEATTQFSNQSADVLDDGLGAYGQSGKRYWLASGSNEPQVQVHDLTSVLGETEPVPLKAPITGAFRTLNGHTLRITALSWSPHGDSRLVSASYDSTVQVWDVPKGEPVANFRGHFGRLFSVVWSVLDPDIIFSGGEDFCLLKWRVSKVQHTKPPAHKRITATVMQRSVKTKSTSSAKTNKRKAKSAKGTMSGTSTPPNAAIQEFPASKDTTPIPESLAQGSPPGGSVLATPADISDLQRLLEEKRLEMQKLALAGDGLAKDGEKERETNNSSVVDAEKDILKAKDEEINAAGEREDGVKEVGVASTILTTDTPDVVFKKDGRRRKKHRSLFPLSRDQDNRGKLYHLEDCIAMAQHKYGSSQEAPPSSTLHPGEGDKIHLGLFADRRAAYAMFREEGNYHDEAGYRDQSQHLQMWKGNLAGALSQAMESNQLNSFLVAMAPLGGYDVWLETVEAYARQLERNEDYNQAATYYLACHKIHKAIAVLVENKQFREAVALASVRLSPFDATFTNVYQAWASHLESEGNYGQAARCYLTINQPADAVMLLARKSDLPSLSTALHLSCITDQANLTNGLMVRYLHECLMAGDWLEAQGLLANHSTLLSGSLVATLHEVIVTALTHQKAVPGDLFKEARASTGVHGMFQNQTQTMDDISEWTSPLTDQSPLLVHAVQGWFQQCCMDPSDRKVVERLYDEVAGIQQENMQLSMTKQLLIQLAFELTLGQLSILVGGASKAVAHWLQAVAMCHDVGDMDIARGILSLVLPEGVQTIKKVQDDLAVSVADVTSLHAYYLFTVLYHLWWSIGNQLSSENPKLGGAGDLPSICPGMETSRVDDKRDPPISTLLDGAQGVGLQDTSNTLSLGTLREDASKLLLKSRTIEKVDKSPTDVQAIKKAIVEPSADKNSLLSEMVHSQNHAVNIDSANAGSEVSLAPKATSLCSRDQDNDEGIHGGGRIEETLCTKLRTISAFLLSEPHARQSCLKGRVRCIQMVVGQLVAQHAREGQQGVTQPQGNGGLTSDRDKALNEVTDLESSASGHNQSSASNVVTRGKVVQEQHSIPSGTLNQNQAVPSEPNKLGRADLASSGKVLGANTNINLSSSEPSVGNASEVPTAEKQADTRFQNVAPRTSLVAEEEGSGVDGLPCNWESMMADTKYSHPAVTYAMLLEEQDRLLQELKELGDLETNAQFPDTLEVAMVLLRICHAASHKMNVSVTVRTELQQLERKVVSWGLEHSWLTRQHELFGKHLSDEDH